MKECIMTSTIRPSFFSDLVLSFRQRGIRVHESFILGFVILKSFPCLQDVYLGGWSDAREVLKSGSLELPEMTVFCGSCGWAPHQLKHEARTGCWAIISASPGCVQQILKGTNSQKTFQHTAQKHWVHLGALQPQQSISQIGVMKP